MATIETNITNIECECVCCRKEVIVPFTDRDLEGYERRFMNGERILIQDALPNVPRELRELFLSGLCPTCWDNLYAPNDED